MYISDRRRKHFRLIGGSTIDLRQSQISDKADALDRQYIQLIVSSFRNYLNTLNTKLKNLSYEGIISYDVTGSLKLQILNIGILN